MPDMTLLRIPLAKILDLLKDRKDRSTKAYYDHETALMNDIRVAGVRNPIKVFTEGEFYRLACGQTRVNAARRAGLTYVQAQMLEGAMTPTRLLIEELTDNNMQQGFDVLAQAEIYLELMRENGWEKQSELCANVPAAKPGPVSKALSIFEGLIDEMKVRLRAGEFGPRLGYALSRLPKDQQAAAYEKVKNMKVEAGELHLGCLLGSKPKKPKPVKVSLTGIVALFSVSEVAKARALLAQIDAALVKVEKHQLPFPSVVQMVKTA